jgi:CHAT domain-containing protein
LSGFRRGFGNESRETAIAIDNLAVINYQLGKLATAIRGHEEALKILGVPSAELGSNYAGVSANLGRAYLAAKRYEAAELTLNKALPIAIRVHGEAGPLTREIDDLLCKKALFSAGPKEAEKCYRSVLAKQVGAAGGFTRDIARTLLGLGGALLASGDYLSAVPYLRKASSLGLLDRSALLRAFYEARRDDVDASFRAVQLSQHSKLANALTQVSARFAAGAGPLGGLIREEQDLTARQALLSRQRLVLLSLPMIASSDQQHTYQERELGEIERRLFAIHQRLRSEFPEWIDFSGNMALSLKETREFLETDEAIILLDFDEQGSYAWYVDDKEGYWTILNVTLADLSSKVKAIRSALTFSNAEPFNVKLAHQIFKDVLGPLESRIASKKRLSFVLNGPLASLPLGVLVRKPSPGKRYRDVSWLLRTHAISVLPSISSLRTFRKTRPLGSASKNLIAFADPVFRRPSGPTVRKVERTVRRSITDFYVSRNLDGDKLFQHLPPLPGTRREVTSVAKLFPPGSIDIRFGNDASEEAVKSAPLDAYRIIYFATHGLVAGDLASFGATNAEPALALSAPIGKLATEDGLLQASEVAQLKLNADWVVLSACNTAASDGSGGEALSGLAKAFIYAGGRSLLVSHWDVSDEATATIMSDLFALAQLKANARHSELLRETSLRFLDEAKTDSRTHPRYWAPFVVVGEP